MTDDLLAACLAAEQKSDTSRARLDWIETWGPRLAQSPDTLLALADRIAAATDEEMDGLVDLLSRALDTARMNRENSEAGAEALFATLEAGLEAASLKGTLGKVARFALCQAFTRAGLPAPDAIRVSDVDAELSGTMPADVPDIADLAAQIIPDDLDPFEAYGVLQEALGAMPREPGFGFVVEMIAQGAPRMVAIGRFVLLHQDEGMQAAAALGFTRLAEAGGVNAALLSELIRVRRWLAAGGAALDPAIKAALRREASGGAVARSWNVHRVITSLPDGSGSQSVMALCSRGKTRAIAALLFKQGQGVKDAYVIPSSSRSEQEQQIAEISHHIPVEEVDVAYLGPALTAALGDGLVAGHPPAPGLIEVAPMLGQGEAVPGDAGAADYLAAADPAGEVAAMSAAQIGRKIGASRDWGDLFDITDSWFMSDAKLMEALGDARTEAAARKVVWAHLEARRDWWATVMARSALILRHSTDAAPRDWMEFAAVAHGLISGRALKKIPIFEDIVEMTLDAATGQGADDGFDAEPPEIAPEGKGELAGYLKGSGLRPDWLDGYLAAVLVAPEFASPQDWLPPLLQAVPPPAPDRQQRFLDIVMLRYGATNMAVMEGQAGAAVRALSAAKFTDWLKGFAAAVTAVPMAWPKRALSRDDRKVLDLIAGGTAAETLKPLLPAWLEQMAEETRE